MSEITERLTLNRSAMGGCVSPFARATLIFGDLLFREFHGVSSVLSIAQSSPKRAERIRCLKRDHAVAEKPEPMGAISGQPISQQTNLGLSRGECAMFSKNSSPCVDLFWPGREEWAWWFLKHWSAH